MSISYQGIGQWCATFACSSMTEGKVVKIGSSNETVAACSAGDNFCGVVTSVAHDGSACSVQLGGFVTVGYSGTAPGLGFSSLVANAAGGVAAAGEGQTGRSYLVVSVDTAAKTVTIKL